MQYSLTLTLVIYASSLAAARILQSPKISFKSPVASRHELQSREFTVRLDHFTPQDVTTVNFTYTQNLDYYRPGGPLYFYINDAGTFTTEFLEVGLMHDIAIESGAALVTADNRYFRSNLPTANASLANLKFLTIEQSVNDIARLIQTVRADLSVASDVRVILWGTGFGAALATYAKQKFPHLINGVWSSSGVYERTVHSGVPYESLTRTIEEIGGVECAANVYNAFEELDLVFIRGQFRILKDSFGFCDHPFVVFDRIITTYFLGITQLLIDFVNQHHASGIVSMCADLNGTEDVFEAFSSWVRHVFTDERCINIAYFELWYDVLLVDWNEIQEINWLPGRNAVYPFLSRPQLYLRCTQLGLFGTNVNSLTLFGRNIGQDIHVTGCQDAFGETYDYMQLEGAIKSINVRYGGKNPNVPNVVYTNGALDTLFEFGITDDNFGTKNAYTINLASYGKSADLFSVSELDIEELIAAKNEIRQLVLEWSGTVVRV